MEISAQWVARQTMLINQSRLTPTKRKACGFPVAKMEKFWFGGSEKAKDFVPEMAMTTD